MAQAVSDERRSLATTTLALIDDAQRRVHARAPRWAGMPLPQLPVLLGFTALISNDDGAKVPGGAAALIGGLWIAGLIGGLMLNARLRTPLVRFSERWPRTGRSPVAAVAIYTIAAVVSFAVATQLSWWWFGFPAVGLVLLVYAVGNLRWHAAFAPDAPPISTARRRALHSGALVRAPFDDADVVSVMAALVVLHKVRLSALAALVGLADDDAAAAVARLQVEGAAWNNGSSGDLDGWVEALRGGRRSFTAFVGEVELAARSPIDAR